MRTRPERILLFRSGRHLRAAMDALRAASPGCEITVVATPAAVAMLEQNGVDAAHRIVYDRTPFFRPWAFVTSGAGVRAVAGRFDRVCVLWNDPDGSGQANVDQTALLVSPGGFMSITADGAIAVHRTAPLLVREVARAAASLALASALGIAVFLPARLLRPFRS
jgi:hypothetical protein